MKKNQYVIYRCVAKRRDDTKIIRVFKIPAHFIAEDIIFALMATGDRDGDVSSIKFLNEDSGYTIDYQNIIYGGLEFSELEEPGITVCLSFTDGSFLEYECERVGEETVAKPITRTTPILLAAFGYSRFTHIEYREKREKVGLMDSYYYEETHRVLELEKELRIFFNSYKEDYCR